METPIKYVTKDIKPKKMWKYRLKREFFEKYFKEITKKTEEKTDIGSKYLGPQLQPPNHSIDLEYPIIKSNENKRALTIKQIPCSLILDFLKMRKNPIKKLGAKNIIPRAGENK